LLSIKDSCKQIAKTIGYEKITVFNILKRYAENDSINSKFWYIQKGWKIILKCLIGNLVDSMSE